MARSILLLALLLPAAAVFGQFGEVGEVLTVTAEPGAQQFPDVAHNPVDNTFLAVWEAVVEDGANVIIRGVLLDGATGAAIGEPFTIMEDIGELRAPEAVHNRVDNEFVVVARFEEQSLAVAQRLSGAGELIGGPVDLGVTRGPTFFDPAARARVVTIAHNPEDNRYLVGTGGPVGAQILFPNLDLDVPVLDIGQGDGVASAWAGGAYLVAWEDRSPRGTGAENLGAQVLAPDGSLVGDVIMIRDQEFAEESPRVSADTNNGRFLVVWDERIGFAEGNDTLTDTIGQLVAPDGSLIGGPIPIEQGTAYTLRQDAAFGAFANAHLVVWKGDESGDFAFADIFGRFATPEGELPEPAFLIYDGGDDATDDGTSERYFDESKLPVVAAGENSGQFLVVWEEGGTNRNPEDRDILARFVSIYVNPVADWALME